MEYVESGNVFETAMVEQFREAMKIWQAEFEAALDKPTQRWQDQLKGTTAVLEKNNSNAETNNNRGIDAAIKGQYETAISEFARAVRKNPIYTDAYFNRGIVYIAIGQLGQAISDFTKVIELNPKSTEVRFSRALVCFANGQYDKAWRDVHKIQSIGLPIPPGFLKNLHKASGTEK